MAPFWRSEASVHLVHRYFTNKSRRSLQQIAGTMKCSRTARGFVFGSGTVSVAALTLLYSD
jgi:hypothetical protein